MSTDSTANTDDRTGGVQVIARTAKILNLLGEKPDGLSLGEISQKVQLPRSTVQRIVNALENEGMIRSGGAGGISLGAGLLRLVTYANTDRIEFVRPWLHKLSETVSETAVLSRRSEMQLVVEHRAIADRELQVIPKLGQLDTPLFNISAGRALLALADNDCFLSDISRQNQYSLNDSDNARVIEQLGEIRKTGYACDHGELLDGITTTAVALDTVLGQFAISMPIPTFRFEKNQKKYIDELLDCKQNLMREIGNNPLG
ncbi:IclR family transcriptional regulator [Pseudomonas aeruginosa]|uniref:IclR family transcriptional regulator n=1 Tax=Pseudomonas aeruginosa TaxID=287 RepID=UPI00298F457D|nr:IclR family transcriptional regulator [Pseudomonas aeruginosa]WPD44482.1 IclR family transcriptional regulator [Pseudomonas aeruginosa]